MPANKLLSYPHDVFLMVRLEFVQICGDELEAKILRVIERYVDEERTRLFQEAVNKTEGTPEQVMSITKDVWVSISYRLFMSDLFGTIASENTIKKAINSLIEKKIIFRRFDKKNRYDAPEYRIHIPVVQMLLNVVGKSGYQKLTPSIIDTLKKLPPHEMTPSECQNLMLSSQSRVSISDTNYNKGNDNNIGNNREREVADATARSQSSSQDNLSEDTEKREAVKPSQKDVAQNGHTHQHPVVDRDLPARGDLPNPRKEDTNKVGHPPAPSKAHVNTSPFPVPKRAKQQGLMDEIPSLPASKPVEPHADMPWGTRKCLQWFDYWRGGTLIAKYKLQQAASCAKGLAEQFDEQTFIEIRNEMAADQYYIDRGGVDVCDVANNCHKYLNKIRTKQKPPSNEHKATQQPANAFIERCLDKDYNKRQLEKMRAENERRRQAQAGGVQS